MQLLKMLLWIKNKKSLYDKNQMIICYCQTVTEIAWFDWFPYKYWLTTISYITLPLLFTTFIAQKNTFDFNSIWPYFCDLSTGVTGMVFLSLPGLTGVMMMMMMVMRDGALSLSSLTGRGMVLLKWLNRILLKIYTFLIPNLVLWKVRFLLTLCFQTGIVSEFPVFM